MKNKKTIWDKINFKTLWDILDKLNDERDCILIAGNLQPPHDQEFWEKAEKRHKEIQEIIDKNQ